MLNFAYIDGMTPIKIVFKLFFQYLMLHMFYYSGIWYPVFMTDILIPILQVHCVVSVWSNSYSSYSTIGKEVLEISNLYNVLWLHSNL